MKTIVTHLYPDCDAITSVWLLKKFDSEFEDAQVKFVSAGKTLDNSTVDSDPNIVHVDTGLGKFDHHQKNEYTCASKKILEYLSEKSSKIANDEALHRMIEVVNNLDHAQELTWPNASDDHYDLMLDSILGGWKLLYPDKNEKYVEWGCNNLDGVYRIMQNKIWAEKELEKADIFETRFGKTAVIETHDDEVLSLAQKKGFMIIARKDPSKKYIRIKAYPDPKIDLTNVYNQLKLKDPEATWFFHVDKHQLFNGSTKDPSMKPTNLTLEDIKEALKNV